MQERRGLGFIKAERSGVIVVIEGFARGKLDGMFEVFQGIHDYLGVGGLNGDGAEVVREVIPEGGIVAVRLNGAVPLINSALFIANILEKAGIGSTGTCVVGMTGEKLLVGDLDLDESLTTEPDEVKLECFVSF